MSKLKLITYPLWFHHKISNVWDDRHDYKIRKETIGRLDKIYPLLAKLMFAITLDNAISIWPSTISTWM
jgi:hypothetical protein